MLKNIWDKILYFGKWVLNFFTRVRKRLKKDYSDVTSLSGITSLQDVKKHLKGEALSFFVSGLKTKASVSAGKHSSGASLVTSMVHTPYEGCYRSSSFGDVNIVRAMQTCLKSFCSRLVFGHPFSMFSFRLPTLTFF